LEGIALAFNLQQEVESVEQIEFSIENASSARTASNGYKTAIYVPAMYQYIDEALGVVA
jgi:hypothetical protein